MNNLYLFDDFTSWGNKYENNALEDSFPIILQDSIDCQIRNLNGIDTKLPLPCLISYLPLVRCQLQKTWFDKPHDKNLNDLRF